MSIIQTNGIALVVLLIVHFLILKDNKKIGFINLISNRPLLLSLILSVTSMLILNPRFLQYDFIPQFIYAEKLHLTARTYDYLFPQYDGIFALFFFSRDVIGLALLIILACGGILSFLHFKKWQVPFLFVIIFFALFNYVAKEIHFLLNLLPVLAIYAAKGYIDAYQGVIGRYKFMASFPAKVMLVAIICFCCLPGIMRITTQNLVNSEISNELKAGLWINENLENKDLIYSLYVPNRVFSAKTAIPEHSGNAPVILADIFPINLPKLNTAEYAIIKESSYYYNLVAKDGYDKYSGSRRLLLKNGWYYGFKESVEEYYNLVENNAHLIKEFAEGNWKGMDQINYQGTVLFDGVPLNQMKDFIFDKRLRSHGPPVRIYKIDNKFKNQLYNRIGIPSEIQEIGYKNGWEPAGLGKLLVAGSNIKYDAVQKEVCIILSITGNGKVAYGEWKFQLLNNYLANVLYLRKKGFKSIMQGLKREIAGISSKDMRSDYIVRELVTAHDNPVTQKYILKVDGKMPNGEIIVRLLGGGLPQIINLGSFYYKN